MASAQNGLLMSLISFEMSYPLTPQVKGDLLITQMFLHQLC